MAVSCNVRRLAGGWARGAEGQVPGSVRNPGPWRRPLPVRRRLFAIHANPEQGAPAVRDTSGEVLRVEEGSLYPALHRMEEAGWIRAEWITKDTGRRARIYELTAAGKKQLAAEESRWQAVTSAVNRVLRTV